MRFLDTEIIDYGYSISKEFSGNREMVALQFGGDNYLAVGHDGRRPDGGREYQKSLHAINGRGALREAVTDFTPNEDLPHAAMDQLQVGTKQYLFVTDYDTALPTFPFGITTYGLGEDGPEFLHSLPVDFTFLVNNGIPARETSIDDIETFSVGGRNFLAALADNSWGLKNFRVKADGSLKEKDHQQHDEFAANVGSSVLWSGKVLAAEFDDRTLLVALGLRNKVATVFRAKIDGTLKELSVLDVVEDEPNPPGLLTEGIALIEVDGAFILVLSHRTLGLLSYRMDKSGELIAADAVAIDDRQSLARVEVLEVVEFGDRRVVLAAGESDVVEAFEVLSNGALLSVGSMSYDGSYYAVTYALGSAEVGNSTMLYAALSDNTLRAFKLKLNDDPMEGGGGNNTLKGGASADHIDGRGGNDRIFGFGGDDALIGGRARDLIKGGKGDDHISGDAGMDTLYGNAGDDRLFGGTHADRLSGGSGNDRLSGEAGSDNLYGKAGNDDLFGGNGNDTLFGGAGHDVLRDGRGSDVMAGGAETDIFILDKDGATDRITDFENSIDLIDLTDYGTDLRFSDMTIRKQGDGVKIGIEGETLFVNAADEVLRPTHFGFSDFLFAE
ncbi:calcium-binding protein [Sedimentitalea sp.]|uniref:calcium-binding protein n=1 Tax=Sedimentitalea sp. TaxID=2048915 RepID=UPI0032970A57